MQSSAETVDIRTGGPVFPPVSVAVVAKLLDLSERRIQQLVRQGVLSKTDRGKYDLLLAVREYVRYLHQNNEPTSKDPEEMLPKERLDWYRGTRERTNHLKEIGELVPAVEFERALAKALKTLAAQLETLPEIIERQAGLDGAAIDRVIVAVDAMRQKLYDALGNE